MSWKETQKALDGTSDLPGREKKGTQGLRGQRKKNRARHIRQRSTESRGFQFFRSQEGLEEQVTLRKQKLRGVSPDVGTLWQLTTMHSPKRGKKTGFLHTPHKRVGRDEWMEEFGR